MPPKRKRASSPSDARKKAKNVDRQPEPAPRKRGRPRRSTRASDTESATSSLVHLHGEVDPDQLYTVRSILEEDAHRYKIDWADGPDGEQYPPTWEPKENVNDAAIEDWEVKKAGRKRKASRALRGSESVAPSSTGSEPPSKKRVRARLRKSTSGDGSPRPVVDKRSREASAVSQAGGQPVLAQEQESVDTTLLAPSADTGPPLPEIDDSLPTVHQHDPPVEVPTHDLQPSADYTTPDDQRLIGSSDVQIRITPRQIDEEPDHSTFSSSQIISGTQPHRDSSPDHSRSHSPLVDAAAATNLTQKHSPYEPNDETSEDTTGSIVVTSSSGVHSFPTPFQFPRGTIIPDSQSLHDSLSYVPSHDNSAESSKPSDHISQSQEQTAPEPNFSYDTNSQIVLESSAPQRAGPPNIDDALPEDNTTQPGEDQVLVVEDIHERSTPIEDLVRGAGAPVSFESPASVSSSTSSPPPAETPDKSQSQIISQSQQLQSPNTADGLHSAEQAAQRPVSVDVDATPITGDNHVLPDYHQDSPSRLSEGPFGTVEEGPGIASRIAQSPFSGHSGSESPPRFATQVFPSSVLDQHTVAQVGVEANRSYLDSTGIDSVGVLPSTEVPSTSVVLSQSSPASSQLQDQDHVANLARPHQSTSSPIPSVPSQSPGTLGRSAPSLFTAGSFDIFRIAKPAGHRMSTSSHAALAKARLHERMNAARAANRAKLAAAAATATVPAKPASAVPPRLQSPALQDREIRSPSMIPAVEAVTKETPEEYFRSERYETLLPGDEPDPRESNTAVMFEPLDSAPKAVNLHNIRYIPINFGEVQRDHYKQTVTWRKDFIDEFTNKVWPIDSGLAHKARKLLQELSQIVLHPDLINDETYTQSSQVEPKYQAQWDADTSTKFRFLKHFFAAAQEYRLSIVLLVEPGRIVRMLQTFLEGINVEYRIAQGFSKDLGVRPTATILTTDQEASGMPSPDMVLVLDGSISDEVTANFQSQLSQGSGPIPAFALIIPKTVEHIARNMPGWSSEADRLHVLVGTVTSLRSEAGRDRDGSDAIEHAATRLVHYFLNPIEWPFEDLPDIRYVDPITNSQASTESKHESTAENSLVGNGTKRHIDDGAEAQQDVKKPKTDHTLVAVEESQDVDASHISDSVSSQQAAAIKALQDEFARKEKDMENALRKSQAQLEEHVKALETLQYDHEEQRNKLVQVESERDKALAAAEKYTLRITNLEARVGDLRDERSNLQEQLRSAKESLLNQTIPERAEFEALKEAASAATAERTKLLNKAKQAEENLDYLREQYQTASNMASQLGKANTALEAQVAELEKKASGEQLKLREKTKDNQAKAQTSRIKMLELTVRNMEELVMRKDEEIIKLKESSRGRMTTRGSSVPRTPRLGSPLAQGTTSRQASPAAGKGPHPLRNAG